MLVFQLEPLTCPLPGSVEPSPPRSPRRTSPSSSRAASQSSSPKTLNPVKIPPNFPANRDDEEVRRCRSPNCVCTASTPLMTRLKPRFNGSKFCVALTSVPEPPLEQVSGRCYCPETGCRLSHCPSVSFGVEARHDLVDPMSLTRTH